MEYQKATQGQSPAKTFKIVKKAFSKCYDIKPGTNPDDSTPSAYTIANSHWSKMDLTLHLGSSKKSSPMACANFSSFGRDSKIGISPTNPPPPTHEQFIWEDLHRDAAMTHSSYSFILTIPQTGERIPLVWKRTSKVAVDGMKTSKLSSKNWKLVDGREGRGEQVLAVFTSGAAFTKGTGVLQFNVDWGDVFERAVVITVLTLYEKARRRDQAASSSGGGGGGGG